MYNTLALEALKEAAAKTSPQTPLRVNDLHHDMVAYCGAGYSKCQLQLTGGVHCTQQGREYTGLSVSFSILDALFEFSGTTSGSDSRLLQPSNQGHGLPPNADALGSAVVKSEPASETAAPEPHHAITPPTCGDPPQPLNRTVPNILLIGDSISMGYG
jgi:hypothetical protein